MKGEDSEGRKEGKRRKMGRWKEKKMQAEGG